MDGNIVYRASSLLLALVRFWFLSIVHVNVLLKDVGKDHRIRLLLSSPHRIHNACYLFMESSAGCLL